MVATKKSKRKVTFALNNLNDYSKPKRKLSKIEELIRANKQEVKDLFISNYGLDLPDYKPDKNILYNIMLNNDYELVKDLNETQATKTSNNKKNLEKINNILENKIDSQNEDMSLISIPKEFVKSVAQQTIDNSRTSMPEWHAPWKLKTVISGHLGWVRAVAVDVSNEWFVTGSNDRTIKIWDLASGTLKLTLTGHITAVTDLIVDPKHPLMFSCGDDKTVRCWDLEQNKNIRSYHGHLSGVYALALHPSLDILVSAGRDSVARVWDIRTKSEIHVLSGHKMTVASVLAQEFDPQVITGSHDSTIRLWDLRNGKTTSVLTHHKKSIRSMSLHHSEHTFISAGADTFKVWKFPFGDFLYNIPGANTIVNTISLNEDNVLVSGGDEGTLKFWDYKTGYNFCSIKKPPQPGSLESESGIFDSTFDRTGSRLITCEADKTIKIWKEDEEATIESHPINYKPSRNRKRY